MLVLGLIIPAYFLLKAKRPRTFIFTLLVFTTGFVLPYLANLVVAGSPMSFRTFYFAPLAFIAMFSIAFAVARESKWIIGFLVAFIAALALLNMGIAQANARDYVTLYNGEVQAISDLETVAAQNHYDTVETFTDSAPINPFGLTYPWQDGHECDFRFNWSAKTFIELYSPLKVPWPSDDGTARLKEETRDLPVTPGIHFHPIPDRQLIYLEAN
jgi:hypothetical protein